MTRSVAPGDAISLSYRIVLRQLTSRARIVGLTLLALVAPLSGYEAMAPTASTAALNKATFSTFDSVGASPVVPPTTMPSEPCLARCRVNLQNVP